MKYNLIVELIDLTIIEEKTLETETLQYITIQFPHKYPYITFKDISNNYQDYLMRSGLFSYKALTFKEYYNEVKNYCISNNIFLIEKNKFLYSDFKNLFQTLRIEKEIDILAIINLVWLGYCSNKINRYELNPLKCIKLLLNKIEWFGYCQDNISSETLNEFLDSLYELSKPRYILKLYYFFKKKEFLKYLSLLEVTYY